MNCFYSYYDGRNSSTFTHSCQGLHHLPLRKQCHCFKIRHIDQELNIAVLIWDSGFDVYLNNSDNDWRREGPKFLNSSGGAQFNVVSIVATWGANKMAYSCFQRNCFLFLLNCNLSFLYFINYATSVSTFAFRWTEYFKYFNLKVLLPVQTSKLR